MRLSRIAGVAVLVAALTGAAAPARAQSANLVITAIDLTNVSVNAVTGVVTASGTITGTLAGIPFHTDITNFVLGPGHGNQCSVLDLELAPISISLAGLHVDTSSICLTITAQRGQGILGDLLCSLAGAGGVLDTLNNILNTGGFLSGLSNILNQALGQARNAPPGGGNAGTSVCTGTCQVLDLVVGPLTLKLLGVTVKLNNCSNGPVQVCVSATASEGLLGELLCGLAGGGLSLQDLLGLIETLVPLLPPPL